MKRNKSSSLLNGVTMVFLLIVFTTFSTISVEAREHHHSKKSKTHEHHHKQKGEGGAPSPLPHHGAHPNRSNIFDILSFGAKGDGSSDDSKALLAAWKAACEVPWATLKIPSEFKFLIKDITLQGPCMPHLVLQIDGTLLAPPKGYAWPKSSLLQWINFKLIHNFTIQGTGTVDGQGSNWWGDSQNHTIQKRSKKNSGKKPTAIRFFASFNVTVRDIRIINSPRCHLKFDSSGQVKINNITISSPKESPNTDGIHLQNAQDVVIQHSNIGCGDDCVSIQTGCSNVYIHHVKCGPGHGISLGGLGKDKSNASVSNIVVDNISMQNTPYGVRIKTWQGGSGSVKNVSFSNIQVSNVTVPVMIDQYYCDDKKLCKNQTGAVAISGVKYDKIIGTYSGQPIRLACSNDIPCTHVDLTDIQLKPMPGYRELKQALCWNSYGKTQAPLVPSSIDCWLRKDGGSVEQSKLQEKIIT